eukprot:6173731-Pleurochrysis_carterae.AAC.3
MARTRADDHTSCALSHLDLFARLDHVDEVPGEHDALLPRETARRHRGGRLLQSQLLVVAVDGLLGVERVGALVLARGALGPCHLGLHALHGERAEHVAARAAVVLAHLELREDTRAASHDAGHLDEAAHVHLPEVADRVLYGQVGDTHMDVGLDLLVLGKHDAYDVHRRHVEQLQHRVWRVRHPDGQNRHFFREVHVADGEGLTIRSAHFAHDHGVPAAMKVKLRATLSIC